MARKSTIQEGEELRGFKLKIYPTAEQVVYLRGCQRELMDAWNLLCISRETHKEHCYRWAEGKSAPPEAPPEGADDATMRDYAKELGAWKYAAIKLAVEHEPALAWAAWRHEYKALREQFGGRDSVASAQQYTALVERFRRTKTPQMKRRSEHMPLQIKSVHSVELFGIMCGRGGKTPRKGSLSGNVLVAPDFTAFSRGGRHNALVKFGPLRLGARYHREPPGPFLEGISIRLEHDGWYASARVRAQPRVLAAPAFDVIAINGGLECLCGMSDGFVVKNPRGNQYTNRVASLSAKADALTSNEQVDARRVLSRYQERMARRTKDVILSQVLPRLEAYREIVISDMTQEALQGEQCRLSKNRLGGYTSAVSMMHELIKQRFGMQAKGGRVREVRCGWESQQCSQCGHYDDKAWKADGKRGPNKRNGTCTNARCRAMIHVDVNAARNLLSRPAILQGAAE